MTLGETLISSVKINYSRFEDNLLAMNNGVKKFFSETSACRNSLFFAANACA